MAYADAKPPLKSDADADQIVSIYPSFHYPGAEEAVGILSQFARLTVADELPKPSGWDDGPVLGISSGDEVNGDEVPVPVPAAPDSRPRFPRRPQEPDCTYYLKFGTCRFGMKCKFDHPKKNNRVKASGSSGSGSNSSINKASSPAGHQVAKENRKETVSEGSAREECKVAKENRKETVSEGSAWEECKYYSMPGGCKFGKSCKYIHCEEKERKTEAENVTLNFLGLPLRPGGKECPYYMRTGSCKFATNCRFHHPDPTNVASRDSLLEHENGDIPQQNVQGSSQLNVSICPAEQRTLNEHRAPFLAPAPSYSVGMIPPLGMVPPQGMYPSPEWNGHHQVPLDSYYPPGISFHPFPAPSVKHPMYRGADVLGHQQVLSDEYPERPGQPECQHFVKSGFCKFRGKCKYHHPRFLLHPQPAGALSPLGLPLKPDQPMCTYYERYGVCKFGPACMYNHPFNFGHPIPAAAPPPSAQYLTSGNHTI